jgi:hypothetical protein
MKKIYYGFSIGLALFVSSCGDFGDINVNPNAAETPLTSALLSNAQSALGAAVTTGSALVSGFYAQYFTQTLYTENSIYAAQDVDWTAELSGSIKDYQTIIDINNDPKTAAIAALQGSNLSQIAIARILKAYRFSVLTDRYGDMPYFEALKGNTQPVFNTQEEIYADLFKELKEASNQFDATGEKVKGDLLYNGDITKWKHFANTLRMILALRIANVDPVKGKAEFLDALASGGFINNTESAMLAYPGSNFKNPWFGLGADQGVANTIADLLNINSDLRLNAFGKPVSGTLIGVPYGMKRADAVNWTNGHPGWSLVLNTNWRSENSVLPIITYADAILAKAEAAQIGWTSENAAAHYRDGLKASWEMWGVYTSDAAFDNFMTKPGVDLSSGNALAKIQMQRWVTFYPNGPQGWSEWRRTGQPVLVPTADAVNNSKQIPIRFPYPSLEFGYNKENLQTAISRLDNGNVDNSHVWWDK